MRPATLVPAVLFLAVAGLFLVAIFGGDPARLPSVLIGKPVPEFELPPVDGLDVPGLSSADFGHGDVAVVNIWASWCVPCRDEHPFLVALAAQGVPLYGLNYKDAPDAARAFLSEEGNPFARIGADRAGRVGIDWGVYGVPETFVVDGEGRIAFKHVGPLDARSFEQTLLPEIASAARRSGGGGAD